MTRNDAWKSGAFAGCTSLTTVPVLNCVDGYRFKHCSSLTTVTLKQPREMHSFVDRAFKNCTSLKVVILDISEAPFRTYCITHAFEGCNDRMEIKFVDQKEIAGNRNPCLKICSYNSDERSWSSMYYALALTRPRDYSCIARFRRTISLVIDMGGGNSCTVTSTLLPGELPSVRSRDSRYGIGQSCRYRAPHRPCYSLDWVATIMKFTAGRSPGLATKICCEPNTPNIFPMTTFMLHILDTKLNRH